MLYHILLKSITVAHSDPPEGGLPYRLEAKLSVARALRALRIEREGILQLNP